MESEDKIDDTMALVILVDPGRADFETLYLTDISLKLIHNALATFPLTSQKNACKSGMADSC